MNDHKKTIDNKSYVTPEDLAIHKDIYVKAYLICLKNNRTSIHSDIIAKEAVENFKELFECNSYEQT